jgi:hypothetical protein
MNVKKKPWTKIVLGLFICLTIGSYLEAIIWSNGIEAKLAAAQRNAISVLTVEGASLFLRSTAATFLLLNEVETGYEGEFDFAAALKLASPAISKLEEVKITYERITEIFRTTPSSQAVIHKLTTFDYEGFAAANNLNKEIMAKVASYLSRGDLLGLCEKNLEHLRDTLSLYYTIQDRLRSRIKPPIGDFWSLLNQYSNAILFGNYVTLVFSSIG